MAPPSNTVLQALVESVRSRLMKLGYDADEPFPLHELPMLLRARDGEQLSYVSILREVRRGRLDAAKVAREWHTTLEAVMLWLARRTWPERELPVTESDKRTADRAHDAVAARLARSTGRRLRSA